MTFIRAVEIGTTLQLDEIPIILRNMAGKDEFSLAVEAFTPVWQLKAWVATRKGLSDFRVVTLAINCAILNDMDRVCYLHELGEHDNVMQLLVDAEQNYEAEDCPNGIAECQAWGCVCGAEDSAVLLH